MGLGQIAPIVLLHGLTASPRVFDPVLAALRAGHDGEVLAMALPWHLGGVELPAGTIPTFDAMYAALVDELATAGVDRAHFVGSSLGGWLALELARDGRARSVVAISPPASWRRTADLRRVVRLLGVGFRLHRLAAPHARLVARSSLLRRLLFGAAMQNPGSLSGDAVAHDLRATASCTWVLEFMRDADRRGPIDPIGDLGIPIVLAWAERDRIVPFERHGRPLLDRLPAVRCVTLPGTGHVPMGDDPALVAKVILDTVRSGI